MPLKLVDDSPTPTGTPLQLGVTGTLLQITPCAVPVEFLNATVPGSRPSTPSEIVPVRVTPQSWYVSPTAARGRFAVR